MVDIVRPEYGQGWASQGERIAPADDKMKLGWAQEMMPFQWENYLQGRQDDALLYLLQKGVPEYSPTQEYIANKSIVQYQTNLYLALATVTNVLPTVTASWKRLSPTLATNGTIPITGGGTGGTTAAEARANLGLGDASSVNLPTTVGVVVKSAANTLVSRTIVGTTGDITVTNPDGVAGNITVGVGSNVAKTNQDSSWTSSGGITIPRGSSSERGVEVPGKIRYNTELQKFEGFDGTSWSALGATSKVEITTLSGDGATTDFTLNAPAFSESSVDVYVGGIWQNKGTYTISGSSLSFSEAPLYGVDNIQVISRRVVDMGHGTVSSADITDATTVGRSVLTATTAAAARTTIGAEQVLVAGTTTQYYRGDKTWQTLNKATVGLDNVDNTADSAKPVSTAQQTALNSKVDKVAGKQLSTEDYTSAEKTKLASVEEGANAYTHPDNHPASIIAQDADNRFVTDDEKTTWNAKQAALVSGTNIKTINGESLLGGGDLVVAGGGGIPDAPTDGKTYGRENAAWVEVPDSIKNAILSYPDYATASAAAATLLEGQEVEAPYTNGRLAHYLISGGVLTFSRFVHALPNLSELGGVSDGETDSTDSVIQANTNGEPIQVPPGEFVTTQKPTVSIEGPGEIIYKGIPYRERGAFTDNRYRKKVLMQVSDKFSASDALKAQYGYSYFYIRGAYLDEDAGLLFVANMPPRGGANDWGWYVVYDTATGQEITYFSAGEVYGKTFSIVYEDGGRYLYTTGPSQAPQKFNLTTLPTPGERLVEVETFSNMRTSFISEFGGDFLCTYDYVTYNGVTGHVSGATLCGKNLAPKSTMTFPISLMGTSDGSAVTLPKCQGVALGAGYVFATFGTNYSVSSGSTYSPRTIQGVRRFTMSGELIDEGLLHPQKFYEKLVAYGYTSATRVEYEGASVCKSGRVISTIHFTSSDVLVVEEFSEAPDALDFSDCADSHSYVGDVWIPKRTGIYGAGITNPLDGSKLTNLGDIAKFMQTSLLYKVLFSTTSTGTTIYETDGVTALPGSTYVEMTRSSANTVFVDLRYFNFSRRMSITTDGSTAPVQAELPTPFLVNYRAGFDNNRRAIVWGNTAPTTGDWVRGDVLYVLNPSADGWLGFVCTASGTPGTWKRFGAVEDNPQGSGGGQLTPAVNGGISISGGEIGVVFGTTSGTACVGNDTRLSNSRPASDVYSWAKQPSKPSYSSSEVGAVARNGDTVTGTLNMSSAPTDKINLGVLNLTGSSTYVGFGNGDFKFRVASDGSATSYGTYMVTTGTMRADGSYTSTSAASANLVVESTGHFRRSTSSLRYKDCVEDVEDALMQAVINEARPIWYRSLCENDDKNNSWWGLGAEELGAIDPRFVHWAHPIVPTEIVEQIEFYEPTGEVDENGNPITKTVIKEERRIENRPDPSQPKQAEGVMYDRLVVPLLWHAKKMQARVEALESRLAALEIASE